MQVKLMNYANPHNCVISATKLIHEKEKRVCLNRRAKIENLVEVLVLSEINGIKNEF